MTDTLTVRTVDAYERLRNDPEAWAAYQAELEEWDAMPSPGLEDEPYRDEEANQMPDSETLTTVPVEVTIPVKVQVHGPAAMFMRMAMASGEYDDGTPFDVGMLVSGAGIVLNLHSGGGAASVLVQHLVEPLRTAIEEAGYGPS